MPQIWLTYDELGPFMNMDAAGARAGVIREGWTRRRCSDGLTRVKLPRAAAATYLLAHADLLAQAEIARLRAMVLHMQEAEARPILALAMPSKERRYAA